MSRLTHVSWSILDEELDGHGYFTIWLHLNKKNATFSSKRSKKVKCSLFKQRYVSEADSPQQSNGTIRFPVSGLQLSKNCIWWYNVIIGHYGEDKNIAFGCQKLSHRVETLHTGWRQLVLQYIFRYFENFEKVWFCGHCFKVTFWNFWGKKKTKYQKSEIAIL